MGGFTLSGPLSSDGPSTAALVMEMVFNRFKGELAMRHHELLEFLFIWLLWGLLLLLFYGYWFLDWFDG